MHGNLLNERIDEWKKWIERIEKIAAIRSRRWNSLFGFSGLNTPPNVAETWLQVRSCGPEMLRLDSSSGALDRNAGVTLR
jgi:hypothetical protein